MRKKKPVTPIKASNDNAPAPGAKRASRSRHGDASVTSTAALTNILGFFELIDRWQQAANDNDARTDEGKQEGPDHDR